jgi:hypothetical protein
MTDSCVGAAVGILRYSRHDLKKSLPRVIPNRARQIQDPLMKTESHRCAAVVLGTDRALVLSQ